MRTKTLQILAMALIFVTLLISITVVGISASIPPKAEILFPKEGTIVHQDEFIVLIGRGDDPDGTIREYLWSVDGLVIGHGKDLSYKFKDVGKHVINLRVIDNDGLFGEDNVEIYVDNRPRIYLNLTPNVLQHPLEEAKLTITIKAPIPNPSTIVEIQQIRHSGVIIKEEDRKSLLTSFEVMSGKPEVKTINVSAIWAGEHSIKLRGYYWRSNDPSNKQWIESNEVSFKVTEEAVPKSPRFVTYDRFLQLIFGLFLFTVIISFIFFLRGNFDKKHIIPLFAVFLIIIVIGYLFVVSQPSIHLNDYMKNTSL